jgi:hypothetical protein
MVLMLFLASRFSLIYPHPYNGQRQTLFRALARPCTRGRPSRPTGTNAVDRVDTEHDQVALVDGTVLGYDVLVIATGAGQYGCKASADLLGLTKSDLIDQVKDIITVGEFYDLAAGHLPPV